MHLRREGASVPRLHTLEGKGDIIHCPQCEGRVLAGEGTAVARKPLATGGPSPPPPLTGMWLPAA